MESNPCIHCHVNGTSCHCFDRADNYQLGLDILELERQRDAELTRQYRAKA